MLPVVLTAFHRAVATAVAWRRQQQDRRQLMAMGEAELRDIGIGRGQIPGVLEATPSQGTPRHAAIRSETWSGAPGETTA